jgi:putative Holliday junction resolvase
LGPQAQLCQKFAKDLGQVTAKPVHLFDERLTSEAAKAKLLNAGLTSKKRRACTDMIAAAIILQSFLDAKDR